MKLVKMKCEQCGALLEVDKASEEITCKYCGAKILIDDEATELKRVEEVKLKARRENHEQALKERQELLDQEIREKKQREEAYSKENFKKSKFSKVLIVFAVLCAIIMIARGFNIAGVIAFLQTALFLTAWLMGMQILKEPKKNLHTILGIIGFVLIIPFFIFGNINFEKYDKIVWKDMTMGELVPAPNSNKGKIWDNDSEELHVDINKVSEKDYKDYVEKCKSKGFTIDQETENNSYVAYNKDGYKLEIDYSDYNKEYSIYLYAPIEMKENAWSSNTLSNKLPIPKSNYGKVDYESESSYTYYAGKMSIEDFDSYITEVKNKGFTLDFYKQDKYYSAKNQDGYKAIIEYEGFNIVKIHIEKVTEDNEEALEEAPDNNSNSSSNENSNSNTGGTSSTNGLSTDFKQAMDSYEKFMNDYVAFMKKYKNSDGTDLSLITEYSKMLSKYNDVVNDFEKWESEDLSDAELKYYLEVQTRVNKKLLEVNN